MKQSLIGLATLALIVGALTLNAAETKDPRPVVRIGIAAPVTGAVSHIGEDIVAWEKLAEKDLAGRSTKLRYEIIVEDDMFQTMQSIQAAKRLVYLNKANVLMTYGGPAGVAVSTFANTSKTPHIAVAYDPRATNGDYNVSFLTPPSGHIPAFVNLLKKKNYSRLAIFAVRTSSTQPILDELHKLDKSSVIKITYEKIYVPGERDFRLGLQFMPVEKIDAVVFLAWSPEVNILMQQYHEEGQNKPIMSLCGALMSSSERNTFAGDIDIYFGDLTEANKTNIQLTGHPISNQSGALAYSEIMMLVDTYENLYAKEGKIPAGNELMKAIKEVRDFKTILGPVSCHPDKFFYFPVNYYRIEKDGFKVIKLEDL
jgi:hypothetical protein